MPSRTRMAGYEDPLAKAFAPPPDESPVEREERLIAEQEARKISLAIDEEINREKLDKKSRPVKVLLLGQSESGKSTTLKNFQLMNSPKAFRTERASWRAVIQLNVVRSIRAILDVMQESSTSPESQLTPDLLKLKLRLIPLLRIEEALVRKLSIGSTGIESNLAGLTTVTNLPKTERRKELVVNSPTAWKGAFSRLVNSNRESFDSDEGIDFANPNDPGVVLHACAEDMNRLWGDPIVRRLLENQKLRLQELAGFFLDSIDRVTGLKYVPTDDDILKARLKTMGVSEYRFKMKAGNVMGPGGKSRDWRVFDVGGQRSLRAAWVPFFDDMDAIIFLAPMSCFDQALVEDSTVNRIEDSILLWKSIVSNPLLKNTNLILFLNKIDILKAKLESGIRFSQFILSYGDRPNDFENVANYLRKKFAAIMKESSPVQRPFYCNFTCVTDTKSTTHILQDVQDMVLRQSLKHSHLMG